MKKRHLIFALAGFLIAACLAGNSATPVPTLASREQAVAASVKLLPGDDFWPPIIAEGWTEPAPMEGPINTPGGEDSPFLSIDGNEFYFFFTPDIQVSAQTSILDGVTGIWVSNRTAEDWDEPKRVPLDTPDHALHADGCPFFLEDTLWFCSVRLGSYREIDFYTAQRTNGSWAPVQNAGARINNELLVGELHIVEATGELFFASPKPGGQGGSDIWVSAWDGTGWGDAVNLGPDVNSERDENRPYVSPDGRELWFDSTSQLGKPGPAVYRCLRTEAGAWADCREIVSQFAGEPNLSADGRMLYFVHHFFSEDGSKMLDADIYVSYREE